MAALLSPLAYKDVGDEYRMITFSAFKLNTSTFALTQAIYDLCAHPEYIADIRAEARAALASENMQWTLETCKKLHLLDSFLKESLRLFAPEGREFGCFCCSSHTSLLANLDEQTQTQNTG
jgi:hypothetical protein